MNVMQKVEVTNVKEHYFRVNEKIYNLSKFDQSAITI